MTRRERIEVRPSGLTEVERVLLRALATHEASWPVAAEAVTEHPDWFEHLATFPTLAALAANQTPDPMSVVEDAAQRALLAQVLLAEGEPPAESAVQDCLIGLQHVRLETEQRALRIQIGEAERAGDFALLAVLSQRKLAIDKEIRRIRQ